MLAATRRLFRHIAYGRPGDEPAGDEPAGDGPAGHGSAGDEPASDEPAGVLGAVRGRLIGAVSAPDRAVVE